MLCYCWWFHWVCLHILLSIICACVRLQWAYVFACWRSGLFKLHFVRKYFCFDCYYANDTNRIKSNPIRSKRVTEEEGEKHNRNILCQANELNSRTHPAYNGRNGARICFLQWNPKCKWKQIFIVLSVDDSNASTHLLFDRCECWWVCGKSKSWRFFSSLDSLALWKKMVVRSGSNRSIPTGNQFCINKPLCVYTVFGLCALLRVSFTANEVCCCCRCRSFVLFLSLLVGLLLIYFVRIETIISFAPERLSPRSKRFLLPFIVHCHFFPLVFVLLSANSKHVSESNCFPMINISALTTRTRTRKSRKENSLCRKKKNENQTVQQQPFRYAISPPI